MWKILVAFIIFAGAALFFISKAGDKVDMQGEANGANPVELHGASNIDSAPKEKISNNFLHTFDDFF